MFVAKHKFAVKYELPCQYTGTRLPIQQPVIPPVPSFTLPSLPVRPYHGVGIHIQAALASIRASQQKLIIQK